MPQKKIEHRKTIFCLLVLAFFTLFFYWSVLLNYKSGKPSLAGNPLSYTLDYRANDLVTYGYPYRAYLAESLSSGRFPFLNPYINGGIQFFSGFIVAPLYPFNFLLAFFTEEHLLNPIWVEIQVLLHHFIAALGMYFLCYRRLRNHSASLLGGLSFGFSGFLIGISRHVCMISTAAWLPWVILGQEMLFEQISGKNPSKTKIFTFISTALVICLSILAGHAQITYYIFLTSILYLIYRLIFLAKERLSTGWGKIFPLFIKVLLVFISVWVIALSLSAVQILPTYYLALDSVRETISLEFSKQYSLSWSRLITFAIPNFFGGLYDLKSFADEGLHWGMGYVGVFPLFLTIFVLSTLFIKKKFSIENTANAKSNSIPFLGFHFLLILFSLLAALGGNTPLHKILFQNLPGYDKFRGAARLILLSSFSISYLAASGWSMMTSNSVINNKDVTSTPLPNKRKNLALCLWISFFILLITVSLATFLVSNHFESFIKQDSARKINILNGYLLFTGIILSALIIMKLLLNNSKKVWLKFVEKSNSHPDRITKYKKAVAPQAIELVLISLVIILLFFDLYGFLGKWNLSPYSFSDFYEKTPLWNTLAQELSTQKNNARYFKFFSEPEWMRQGSINLRNEGSVFKIPSALGYWNLTKRDYEHLLASINEDLSLKAIHPNIFQIANIKYLITDYSFDTSTDLDLITKDKNLNLYKIKQAWQHEKLYRNIWLFPEDKSDYLLGCLKKGWLNLEDSAVIYKNPEFEKDAVWVNYYAWEAKDFPNFSVLNKDAKVNQNYDCQILTTAGLAFDSANNLLLPTLDQDAQQTKKAVIFLRIRRNIEDPCPWLLLNLIMQGEDSQISISLSKEGSSSAQSNANSRLGENYQLLYSSKGPPIRLDLGLLTLIPLLPEETALLKIELFRAKEPSFLALKSINILGLSNVESDPELSLSSEKKTIAADTFNWISYTPEKSLIASDLQFPALMLIKENYEEKEGWKAMQGVRKIPVFKADLISQGIFLNEGSNEIFMRYIPPGFAKGLFLSLFSLALILILAAWWVIKERAFTKKENMPRSSKTL